MLILLAYFVIGFIGLVLALAYDQTYPVPVPPQVSFMESHVEKEERGAIQLCAFFLWPRCLVVLLFKGVFKLARFGATLLVEGLGGNESNPRP